MAGLGVATDLACVCAEVVVVVAVVVVAGVGAGAQLQDVGFGVVVTGLIVSLILIFV
jgi:hypothetical protein